MLDLALIGTLAFMGLVSLPHCALMCGAPCAAVTAGGAAPGVQFQIGRLISYGLLGALGVTLMGLLSEASAVMRPLWLALQLGVLVLGGWLLVTARWPAAFGRFGRTGGGSPAQGASAPLSVGTVAFAHSAGAAAPGAGGRRAPRLSLRAAGAGLLWGAWPCGLLQGALLTAALANTPAAGAAAMAAFALASSPGLIAAPALLRRLAVGQEAWAARLAGLLLMGSAAWALGHGLWLRVAALCGL